METNLDSLYAWGGAALLLGRESCYSFIGDSERDSCFAQTVTRM